MQNPTSIEKARLPNVLLITADQWRGDCLSAVGHACVKTPGVDTLAREGTLFRRHYLKRGTLLMRRGPRSIPASIK